MTRLISGFLATLLGLWLAVRFVSGFEVNGGLKGYLVAAIVLALLNFLLKPVLKIISYPLIIITLGLFSLVVNALILWLAAQATGYIVTADLAALLWASIIITVVGSIGHVF